MLLEPCPDGVRIDDPEPARAQNLAQEIGCNCLADRLSQALSQTGCWALREIGVTVRDGAVFLEGRVPSYYLKQLAPEGVRQVLRDAIIMNKLNVAS